MKLLFENGVADVLVAPAELPVSNVKLAVRARGVEGGSVAGGVIALRAADSFLGTTASKFSRICL